jgi:chloramphenicol O-acetyltransferase
VAQQGLRSPEKASDDIVFHSVLPWLRFTSFTNALPGKGDSIPRIVFDDCRCRFLCKVIEQAEQMVGAA